MLWTAALWAFKWITGKGGGLLLDFYKEKNATAVGLEKQKTERHIKELETDLEYAKLRKEILILDQEWWAMRWVRPAIAWPFIAWLVLVVDDTIFDRPWVIHKLPPPLDEWAGAILLSFFLIRPVEKAVSSAKEVVTNWIGKGKK